MTLKIHVKDCIKVLDIILSALKRIISGVKKFFSTIISKAKQAIITKSISPRGPPVKSNRKVNKERV